MVILTVDEWVLKAQGRLEAVVKTAAQAVATNANTPTAKGGRMRVDTGFLRNSIKASVGKHPYGVSNARFEPQGDASAVEITIAKWDITKPLYVGWTANYAIHREAFDGFLEAELMQWQDRVDAAVSEAKQRIK